MGWGSNLISPSISHLKYTEKTGLEIERVANTTIFSKQDGGFRNFAFL